MRYGGCVGRRVATCVLLLLPCAARAEAEPQSFEARVNATIEKGVHWLLARPRLQKVSEVDIAHWGLLAGDKNYSGGSDVYACPAGVTALALYTLLKCDVDPEHPLIERGFAWLKVEHEVKRPLDGQTWMGYVTSHRIGWNSYELSAQILALTTRWEKRLQKGAAGSKRKLKITDSKDRRWLKDLTSELVARRGIGNPNTPAHLRRGWRYNLKQRAWLKTAKQPKEKEFKVVAPEPPADQDLSSTQLAALALYGARRLGVDPTKPALWVDIATFTLDNQEPEGPEHPRHDPGGKGDAPLDHARGFAYSLGAPHASEGLATGGMTACGIANLVMARNVLTSSASGRARWKKLEARATKGIHDGLAWLDRHWSPFVNPPAASTHSDIYYLYAMERAMDLLGKELIGKHVWYREGAEELLKRAKEAKVKIRLGTTPPEGYYTGVYWDMGRGHLPPELLGTCFALLFLKRATLVSVTGD